MQKMYKTYKDVAEFRLVYINEAHAADGRSMQRIGKNLGVFEHKNYGERCQVAERLLNDKKLTIPTVIDGMDNKVNQAYKAWPDRVFIVGTDGKLGVAATRGPFGFASAIEQAGEWLAEYKKSGKELALQPKKPDFERFMRHNRPRPTGGERSSGKSSARYAHALGSWEMKTALGGSFIEATMTLTIEDGKLTGVWASQGGEMKMSDIKLDGNTLSFTRTMGPGGSPLAFKGEIDGDKIEGKYTHKEMGELKCTGKRS